MKTKELIRLLQKEDPSGEIEVCVGNVDISWISMEPAYYDGPQQVLTRNEKGKKIGGKYCRSGHKIQIHLWGFSELIWDYKDAVIDYSELDEERQKSYKENHDKIRDAAKNCDYKLELENFTEWAKEKATLLADDGGIVEVAKDFFDANITPYDRIPDDIPIIMESHDSRRQKQWNRQFEVSYSTEGFKITKKEIYNETAR